MTHRSTTLWALQCDEDRCMRIAAPTPPTHLSEGYREGRYVLLSGTRDAIAAARADGWESTGGVDPDWYCSEHKHLVPTSAEESAREPVTTPRTPAAMMPTHGVEDVALPGMPEHADH